MHHNTGEPIAPPVSELITVLRLRGIDELREVASGCPVCMFAAIRQTGMHRGTLDEEGYTDPPVLFDLKAELAEFWKEVNNAAAEDRSY